MKTLRIISYNVNGIRAALNKGLLEWLSSDPADIICLQETKAEKENINLENKEIVNELDDNWCVCVG